MEDDNQFYIELPCQYNQKLRFTKDGTPEKVQHRTKEVNDFQYINNEDCSIDEQLLQKTSQMHEALRNKKLLTFELIQAKIMKKSQYSSCASIEEQLKILTDQIETTINENQLQKENIFALKNSVNAQMTRNRQLLRSVQKANQKIVKTRKNKQLIEDQSLSLIKSKIEGHGFISIEQIKLQAQNQSKEAMIDEIKKMISELKGNIKIKQLQNDQLQQQYQQILVKLKKSQQTNKLKQSKSKRQKQPSSTYRVNSQIQSTNQYTINNENDMQSMNQMEQKRLQNISQNESKLSKQQHKKNKLNTEKTVNKKEKQRVNSCRNISTNKKKQINRIR